MAGEHKRSQVATSRRSNSFFKTMLYNGVAAVASKTAVAPLERIKLLLQCQPELIKTGRLHAPYTGITNCFAQLVRGEGVVSLWRGNLMNVVRYVPYQAGVYFASQEIRSLTKKHTKVRSLVHFAAAMTSGSLAGLVGISVSYPFDYIRTRLANDVREKGGARSYQFRGILDVYRRTVSSDGIVGVYRGFWTTALGAVLYRSFYFAIHATVIDHAHVGKGPFAPLYSHSAFGLSVLTLLCTSLLVYPLDTVRRRMMMRSGAAVKYRGAIHCAQAIVEREGWRTLYRGGTINIVRSFAAASMLTCFDKVYYAWKQSNR
eukprot:m.3686 g.3686  ORF g.3686 m.3686 type:complete len:317 (-) comp4279_c0_seq1:1525-2475(-)